MSTKPPLACPICDKEIEIIKDNKDKDLPNYSLRRHMGESHNIVEIISAFVSYYLEALDYPLSEALAD